MADVELPRFPRAGRDIFGLDPVEDSLPPLVLVSGIVSGGGVAQVRFSSARVELLVVLHMCRTHA